MLWRDNISEFSDEFLDPERFGTQPLKRCLLRQPSTAHKELASGLRAFFLHLNAAEEALDGVATPREYWMDVLRGMIRGIGDFDIAKAEEAVEACKVSSL